MSSTRPPPSAPRRGTAFYGLALVLVALGIGLVALAVWQVERRAWKRALIDRVDARVHAAPVDPPGPARWQAVTVADDEYRRVVVRGVFEPERATFVRAVTVFGSGYWMLVPLRRDDGSVVLVNRGFVDDEGRRRAAAPPTPVAAAAPQPVTVVGLLRITEPGGAFARRNEAADDRWYSRDVAAIAARRGLRDVAPFFVDAEADAAGVEAAVARGDPVGGLTVVSFADNHALYATIWTCLALLDVAALMFLIRGGTARHGSAAR